MTEILAQLNDEQRAAATHIDGALLILAGAGSGKTKTLTTRLAYLIDSVGIPAPSTLTLTFTNKAATQMRTRALNLISHIDSAPPLLCTFHKFGLLFLKFHINELGRKADFTLIDTEDRKRIIRTLSQGISTNLALSRISQLKNAMIAPQDSTKGDELSRQIARIYALYEDYLLKHNMLDFDDLLLLPYRILRDNADLRESMSRRYAYIMVDEYQDTNELQYRILRCLTATHENLCVVGDDDQSIYGWRGADINNILDFGEHFSGAKIIRLERNYRSTDEILRAANALISHNTKRLGKELKSTRGGGKAISVVGFSDEKAEAAGVAKRIRGLMESGVACEDIAILFRLNALSRSIEEALGKEKIPYKLIGAVRFYERAEIKDILSYFRLVNNANDDFSLLRIINRPRRGIGKITQEKLESFAAARGISIFEAISKHRDSIDLPKRQLDSIAEIFALIAELREAFEESCARFLDIFKEKVKILESFSDGDEVDREANISEFYGFFKEAIAQNPSLEDFLNDISLSSDEVESEGAVSCMSVHSAKGLEFEHLFVIGFEQGIFPLSRDDSDMEEERRLGYVALTRAKSELTISYTKSRLRNGRRENGDKSMFLRESGLIAESTAPSTTERDNEHFKKNDLVAHKIFGAGRVLSVESEGAEAKLTINFGGITRKILASFITKVEV